MLVSLPASDEQIRDWAIEAGYLPDPTPWQPYTGKREKRFHDIKLHDGSVHRGCWPNADSFFCCGDHSGREIPETQVASIHPLDEDWMPSRTRTICTGQAPAIVSWSSILHIPPSATS